MSVTKGSAGQLFSSPDGSTPAQETKTRQSRTPATSRTSRTSTSSFGVSKREGHDASAFYGRFSQLRQDTDALPEQPKCLDQLIVGDSRDMKEVNDNCVALVVTSPPYFAGKEYELELGTDGIPGNYVEYLEMLYSVFQECWRVLEPGGRIAVNVANLGRKPYRSLSSDIVTILQNDIGFLLRGEVIWQKARGASGSCAWGSFRSASNPVLRDVTERIVIASKLRLDRAIPREKRAALGLPHKDTIRRDEFLEFTLDVWEMQPASAKRVGHPAPFPIELPWRLIKLYTYENDLVLDPFLGSGTTAKAANNLDRHYVGYDLDPSYIERAKRRLEEGAQQRLQFRQSH